MAKKREMKDGVSLGKRTITKIKKKEINVQKVNKAVEKIHQGKEKNIRLSIDVPEGIYYSLKADVLQERTTVRGYILKLIDEKLANK